jgi:hypothetical protein
MRLVLSLQAESGMLTSSGIKVGAASSCVIEGRLESVISQATVPSRVPRLT